MRVALVHDYLNQYGGGERVLEALMEIFPEAPIFTLFYDEEKTLGRFRGRVAKTSLLDFPLVRENHRFFIPLMPTAANFLDLGNDYDLIISDSAGYAKGISYGKNTKHISYVHTPLRYAWEAENYFNGAKGKLLVGAFRPVLNYLKNWDYRAGQKPDVLIANSQFIAGKIKNYYNREAKVIYPPVDTEKFYLSSGHSEAKLKNLKRSFTDVQDDKGSYYLAVGRLLHYKKFDLVIDAFAKLDLPLKIVGSGPEQEKLKAQSEKLKAKVEFIPFVKSEEELRKLYNGARALIFPQVEDFGLVAAEAQACGTPVIAYAGGGALEIVKDGKTGIFFNQQTAESLIDAVEKFEKTKFIRSSIARSAKKFSKENFAKQFLKAIQLV